MNTVEATYKASAYDAQTYISVTAEDLPIELNQMIVWIMCEHEAAVNLLPEYRKLAGQKKD